MMIRVTVGYNDAPCDFEMTDGEALWQHIETLVKHSPKTEKDLEIKLTRMLKEEE